MSFRKSLDLINILQAQDQSSKGLFSPKSSMLTSSVKVKKNVSLPKAGRSKLDEVTR
jgi:hypothetical protein